MSWVEAVVDFHVLDRCGGIVYLLLCTVVTLVLFIFLRRRRKLWIIEELPGPKSLPILGNALDFNVSRSEIFSMLSDKLCNYDSSVSKYWIGMQPYCVIYKCTSAEVILSSRRNLEKSKDYDYLHPWLGTGLLTARGEKWHSRRKLLTQTFHFKILEDFLSVFNRQSTIFLGKLEAHSGGKTFDIYRMVTLCTLDVILESAMGVSINAQDNADSDYVKAIYKLGGMVQQRMMFPWLQPDILYRLLGYRKEFDKYVDILHTFSKNAIAEKKEMFKEKRAEKIKMESESKENLSDMGKKRQHLAFLDLLLEAAETNALNDEGLLEEVETFMFAGHDTTATAINWCLYLLGWHPDIQKRVMEEIDSIFEGSDRPVAMADLREMKYLECCIKEALRLFPPVPFYARKIEENIKIDGYTIPEGTIAMVVPFRIHRDPSQYPDPEVFQPERFFAENAAKRHPFAYIPFSAGTRNCIGQKFAMMEQKVMISSFLRKFRIESEVKFEDLILVGELILRPENGNLVRIFPRTRARWKKDELQIRLNALNSVL